LEKNLEPGGNAHVAWPQTQGTAAWTGLLVSGDSQACVREVATTLPSLAGRWQGAPLLERHDVLHALTLVSIVLLQAFLQGCYITCRACCHLGWGRGWGHACLAFLRQFLLTPDQGLAVFVLSAELDWL